MITAPEEKEEKMPKYIDIEPIIRHSEIQGFDVVTVDLLKNLPIADVRENVHGEWVKNEDRVGWHCSCCGVDNYYAYCWNSETGKSDFQDKYCPNCGVKMRGDGNDDDNGTD